MSETVIKIENLSKQYRLGLVGTGTLSHDLNRWWHRVRGNEDPYLKIGETNDRTVTGSTNYVWALRDINLEVKQGEVLGIIGKNGAGKSTLLKILSRVTGPTTGSIKVKGRIGALLEVGTGFHPELTGKENIFLNGAILGMKKLEIKSKLEEIIEFSGTARYIDTPVKRYSSGMKVRLAFSVAAHLDPEILVVDEVLAVGDAEFQEKAIGKMKDVSEGEGRTVLFVSHNMESIQNLCQKVSIIENGILHEPQKPSLAIATYVGGSLMAVKENSKEFFNSISSRRGDGQVYFDDIKMINQSGEINTFEIGEGESVEFIIRIKSKKILGSAMCAVAFLLPKSKEMIFSSEKYNINFNNIENSTQFKISFKEIPLNSGIYNLYFWLGADRIKEKFDIIYNELPPLIVKTGNRKTGNLKSGLIDVPSTFEYV